MNTVRLDPLTPQQRSERMSRIRSRDTKPEMEVRRIVHSMGYRYRLRSKDIPGRPDLVFRRRKKVIFVHGCFWHQHGCNHYKEPQSRLSFWLPKLRKNVDRDLKVQSALKELGWRSLTIWECQLKEQKKIQEIIRQFMEKA